MACPSAVTIAASCRERMLVARLAFLTFAVLREPWDSPAMAGFVDRLDPVGAGAHAAHGFIGADDEDEPEAAPSEAAANPWGPFTLPAFYRGSDPDHPRAFSLLSVWRDIESVFSFAYSGAHLEALGRRAAWIADRQGPTYVAWWIGDEEYPTWADGAARLDRLRADGPSPAGFDFHHPFDADGRPVPRPRLRRPA
jgi:hypothetical protein